MRKPLCLFNDFLKSPPLQRESVLKPYNITEIEPSQPSRQLALLYAFQLHILTPILARKPQKTLLELLRYPQPLAASLDDIYIFLYTRNRTCRSFVRHSFRI